MTKALQVQETVSEPEKLDITSAHCLEGADSISLLPGSDAATKRLADHAAALSGPHSNSFARPTASESVLPQVREKGLHFIAHT
jgi:hypothetical protein